MTAERKASTKGFESAGALGLAHAPTPIYISEEALSIHQIEPDPDNPRTSLSFSTHTKGEARNFNPALNALDWDLKESIDQHGIIEPLVVRFHVQTVAGKNIYRIVCGHRRYAAAKYLGMETVPCRIGNLTADAAREIQMIENLQRQDLSAVEEARQVREMIDKHGYTAESLGKKLGKHKSWVYARVKLANLPELAAKCLAAGKIGEQVALLIARIPGGKSREAAAKEICGTEQWKYENGKNFKVVEPMTFVHAKYHIEHHYSRELKGCEFDTKDAALVKAAGACDVCPKRTGNIPEHSGARADVCTDPECFSSKTESFRFAKLAELRQKFTVLTKEEGAELMPYGKLLFNSKYVDLDEKNNVDPKRGTWRKALGPDLVPIIAQDDERKIHYLVLRSDAEKTLTKLGITESSDTDTYQSRNRAFQKKLDEQAALSAKVDRVIFDKVADAMQMRALTSTPTVIADMVRLLIEKAIMDLSFDSFLELRGIPKDSGSLGCDRFPEYLKELKPAQFGELIAQVIALDYSLNLSRFTPKWLKFDRGAIQKQIKGESNGKAEAGKPAESKKSGK
jgi:ParB family transcriptional regulator, chromosome partitioning protein